MNGKRKGSEVFMEATGREKDDKLLRGVDSCDAAVFISYVCVQNNRDDEMYSYIWKRIGNNSMDKKRPWSIKCLDDTLKKPGKYILMCKSKRNDQKHKQLIKSLKSPMSESEKLLMWHNRKHRVNKPYKSCTVDHAIAIVVDEDMTKKLYDNGLKLGVDDFSVSRLADRVDDVGSCYVYEISKV
jgi:hypothetical protein